MSRQISVFGGAGFVGSEFCKLYPDTSIKIPREDRDPKSRDALYMISTTDNYNVFSDPFIDIDTNLRVLMETLDRCKENNIETFNFVSSWFVYGDTELPATEESYCNPKGFYSITKRCAEQLIISYCKTFNIDYRILRLCNIYGNNDLKVSKKRNAFQYLVDRLKDNLDINLYHNGEFYRNFMHVSDVCRAIMLVCNKGDKNSIYNIGSMNNYIFKDIIQIAVNETGSKSRIGSMEPPAFHNEVQVKDMTLDVKKLYSLGFNEVISLEDGIKELCEK
jgi:nucleoside-diphosphate-sugar epimerase